MEIEPLTDTGILSTEEQAHFGLPQAVPLEEIDLDQLDNTAKESLRIAKNIGEPGLQRLANRTVQLQAQMTEQIVEYRRTAS